MTALDLHPLSLGEILSRTVFLYRRNFFLFTGIALIPLVPVLPLLALGLSSLFFHIPATLDFMVVPSLLILLPGCLILFLVSYAATVFAITDLYLGRHTSIGLSLYRGSKNILPLIGVLFWGGLVIGLAFLALVIPGVYAACRLFVCLPTALIEGRSDWLSRSFELTKGFAGRAFAILALFFVLSGALGALLSMPFQFLGRLTVFVNAGLMPFWAALAEGGSLAANVAVNTILLIANSVYYYDLRVRKEMFDQQFKFDPTSEGRTRSQYSVLSIRA
jgi:hypothetical protein